jgi:hypothetical protein
VLDRSIGKLACRVAGVAVDGAEAVWENTPVDATRRCTTDCPRFREWLLSTDTAQRRVLRVVLGGVGDLQEYYDDPCAALARAACCMAGVVLTR